MVLTGFPRVSSLVNYVYQFAEDKIGGVAKVKMLAKQGDKMATVHVEFEDDRLIDRACEVFNDMTFEDVWVVKANATWVRREFAEERLLVHEKANPAVLQIAESVVNDRVEDLIPSVRTSSAYKGFECHGFFDRWQKPPSRALLHMSTACTVPRTRGAKKAQRNSSRTHSEAGAEFDEGATNTRSSTSETGTEDDECATKTTRLSIKIVNDKPTVPPAKTTAEESVTEGIDGSDD